MELTLKEASLLCRKSEKTLRRKIECGLLQGRKEPLEFGGFMWLIDVESLEALYPGSRPSQLPQVWASPELPQVRLRQRPEEDPGEQRLGLPRDLAERPPSESPDLELDEDDDDEEWGVRPSFLEYIIDENRGLKLELKERDARILGLSERAMVLERALGEQEGKASTQARVLEWFQNQEAERERHRADAEQKMLQAGPTPAPAPTRLGPAVLVGMASSSMLLLLLWVSGLLTLSV